MSKTFFFCGIGGSGMSSIAGFLASSGYDGDSCVIKGSDRAFDSDFSSEIFKKLQKQGIEIFPQDGTGITKDIDFLVVSAAVEQSVPDVQRAEQFGIPIIKRAELLAKIANQKKLIAVGGTSGKSTVTGMIWHCLRQLGADAGVINGAVMIDMLDNFPDTTGSSMAGKGEYLVCECDESDGTIALYKPYISVLTNISEDHKEMEELRKLFKNFLSSASFGAVVNIEDAEAEKLSKINLNTIAYSDKFRLNLKVPGRHNISNAHAAIAVCKMLGFDEQEAIRSVESFKGIKSRLEVVGIIDNGVTIIDDFAHNPDKIAASLSALKEMAKEKGGRLLIMYQPHGFAPTKKHKDALIKTFGEYLGADDILAITEIFYAGGTADKSVSSREIAEGIGKNAHFFKDREKASSFLREQAKAGDIITIMGARDNGLRQMARGIAKAIG